MSAGTVDLQPVLDAIAELKTDVSELGTRMDRLEQKVDQQGTLILDAIANLAVKVTRIEEKTKPGPSRKREIGAVQRYSR